MKHFSSAAKKRGMRIITCGAAVCLCAGTLVCGNGITIPARAEQPDCSFGHDHKIITGAVTGDEYEVGKQFGSDIAYEAPKISWYDAPVIDGFKDDIWDEYEDYAIQLKAVNANGYDHGIVQYLWQDGSLFVWAEFYENTICFGYDESVWPFLYWGDNINFYIDTLHSDQLAADDWDGYDGVSYRGDNDNSGYGSDGSAYSDCAVGNFKISAGVNQTMDDYDSPDNKINSIVDASGATDVFGNPTDRRTGNVEWQQYTWLASACQWDEVSNFTSAYIFDDWDIHDPYERGLTTDVFLQMEEYAQIKEEYGNSKDAIGYTFEAQIAFKSDLYEPTDGSVIGAGILYDDWNDCANGHYANGWMCKLMQEESSRDMNYDFVRQNPRVLPNLVLLPGDDDGNYGYDAPTQYTVTFLDGQKTAYTYTGVKGDVVPTPPNPIKEGYTFLGWTGFTDGYEIKGNKSFRAEWERNLDSLPDAPAYSQDASNTIALKSGEQVSCFTGERTTASITLDGVPDAAYYEAEPVPIGTRHSGNTEVYGVAYVIYDKNYLYAFVTVYDPDVCTIGPIGGDSANVFGYEANWDNVSLFIDTYNKSERMSVNHGEIRPDDWCGEGRFRINAGADFVSPSYFEFDPWMLSNTSIEKEGASRVIEGQGYTAEFKISWGTLKDKGMVTEGSQIALEFEITDGDADTTYGKVCAGQQWSSTDLFIYDKVGAYSKLELVDDYETEPEKEPKTVYPVWNNSSNNAKSAKKKLSGGAIAGIAVGSSVGAAGAAIGGCFLVPYLLKKKAAVGVGGKSKKASSGGGKNKDKK